LPAEGGAIDIYMHMAVNRLVGAGLRVVIVGGGVGAAWERCTAALMQFSNVTSAAPPSRGKQRECACVLVSVKMDSYVDQVRRWSITRHLGSKQINGEQSWFQL